jgi:hypothetical protein
MISALFKPFLWSYDFQKLNKNDNKKAIIEGVLNYGTNAATQELFKTYNKKEIKEVFLGIEKSSFNKKSFNYWNLILN